MKSYFFIISCLLSGLLYAQISVYPTNWWTGMHYNKLQLMVHSKSKIGGAGTKVTCNTKDIKITAVDGNPPNPGYVFIDVEIAPTARPQTANFTIEGPSGKSSFDYEMKSRRAGRGTAFAQGVTSSDFVYLIMPDRFSNGDPANDQIAGMADKTFSRDSMYYRHGGDIQGVINHLDYLKDMGVTTVWLTPVLENDMPRTSYHGYAFTDHYTIDPRFGGDTAYQRLINTAHRKGMKIIQDAVYNHVGTAHWFVKDMPMPDWVHQWPAYTNTTYKDQVLFDPYASADDKARMSNGWFVRTMPDLNQENPYVANFLIQHAIWTVEAFGIDGWRVDTYAYNNLDFMNRCYAALLAEYPSLSIYGETWVHGVPNQSYFAGNRYNIPFKSNQPGVTDFQALWGITHTATKDFGWTEGVNELYTTLAQDYVYEAPMKNVVFLDNHDLSRFYSVIGTDMEKYKMCIAWLLTTRGIPQWYYGAEIAMEGLADPDGLVRMDFPGGWPGDSVNKFVGSGRTAKEDSLFNYIKTIATYRMGSSAIKGGKLMQFTPDDWVYTYFRYDDNGTVMIVMNTGKEPKKLDLQRFKERTTGFTTAKNIVNNVISPLEDPWTIPAKTTWVLELR